MTGFVDQISIVAGKDLVRCIAFHLLVAQGLVTVLLWALDRVKMIRLHLRVDVSRKACDTAVVDLVFAPSVGWNRWKIHLRRRS